MALSPHQMGEAPEDLRRQLRLLLADRRSPEAAALFQVLLKYIHKRVYTVNRNCGGSLSASVREEVVADVLLQLMRGSLACFRGESLPELLGFVRTIADRCTWRAVRSRERERAALSGIGSEQVRDWSVIPPAPDSRGEVEPDSPLSTNDQEYLRSLLDAGSKAELARRAGVSRAAVTQRVQRIRARITELAAQDRMAHEVWMRQAAKAALAAEAVVDAS